jgi:hypothetical protein
MKFKLLLLVVGFIPAIVMAQQKTVTPQPIEKPVAVNPKAEGATERYGVPVDPKIHYNGIPPIDRGGFMQKAKEVGVETVMSNHSDGVVNPAAAPVVFKPTPASDKPAAANPSKDGELLLNPNGIPDNGWGNVSIQIFSGGGISEAETK